jgi:hypothetical protein
MEIVKDNTDVFVGEPVESNLWDIPLFQTTREEDQYVTSIVDELFPEQGKERIHALHLIDRLYYEAKLKCQQQLLTMFQTRSAK